MPPDDRDVAYLWDMPDAARTVRELAMGVSLHDYLKDRKLQLAVERAVEIVGEAARRVSDGFRTAHPGIPWRRIVGQRTILAHDYGAIRQERMWRTATVDVPALIALLEPLVPDPPPGETPWRKEDER